MFDLIIPMQHSHIKSSKHIFLEPVLSGLGKFNTYCLDLRITIFSQHTYHFPFST